MHVDVFPEAFEFGGAAALTGGYGAHILAAFEEFGLFAATGGTDVDMFCIWEGRRRRWSCGWDINGGYGC